MKIKISYIIFILFGLFLIWFICFRTKELTITYDGVEETAATGIYGNNGSVPQYSMKKSMARNEAFATTDLALANAVSAEALYDETESEEASTEERYRENKYYRVDTFSFDSIVENLNNVIKELNGTIKINQQNSNKKTTYDKEFYPRFQELEFTIDNSQNDLEKIEQTLKKWGDIRISNSNISSIEQELTNYEQQLKEMEEARKALQESKDKDWIARQDSELAKKSERIKNQIENAKKQSTYKTYTINIYEVIKFKVNAIKYWYTNNYILRDAISNVLPEMVKIFAKLIPVTLMLILFIGALSGIYRRNKKKMFKERLEEIKKEFGNQNIHFDMKM